MTTFAKQMSNVPIICHFTTLSYFHSSLFFLAFWFVATFYLLCILQPAGFNLIKVIHLPIAQTNVNCFLFSEVLPYLLSISTLLNLTYRALQYISISVFFNTPALSSFINISSININHDQQIISWVLSPLPLLFINSLNLQPIIYSVLFSSPLSPCLFL